MSAPVTLSIFLSSPGDVPEERELARKVMRALEGSPLLKGRVRFEVISWDDAYAAAPMDARQTPQASVNQYTGRPADCDLTLVVLWSRIGTCLPPGLTRADGSRYESGTVWEYEDALGADKPVFVYRRTTKPQIDIDDAEYDTKHAQYVAVKTFFNLFTNADGSLRAGFNPYAQPQDFERLLRQHLESFVNERLGGGASATQTPRISPDDPKVSQVLTLIDELGRKNKQIDEKQAEIVRLQEENERLRRGAIARTLTAAAQPLASAVAREAGAALEAGNPGPAEALLREQERIEADTIDVGIPEQADRRRQAAELARELGALAFAHDVRVALAAYVRAAEYEPQNTWTRFFIGDLQLLCGDVSAAMENYHLALGVAQELAARDPANSQWQRDLSVSYTKVGDVLVAQGDVPGALRAHYKSLSIAEALAAQDPANTQWQRDLSVIHNKIGDVLVAQGDEPGALSSYRKGLSIAEALAAQDPDNTVGQRDLSVSHNKIGDVLVAQGDGPGALCAHRKSLAIAEALAARDPANTVWQRDLSVTHNKVGDVLAAQSDSPGALSAYRKGLSIAEALAARDPANTLWQRDLSISHARIGDALVAQGDTPGALVFIARASPSRKRSQRATRPIPSGSVTSQ